jgi:hypothetical protein
MSKAQKQQEDNFSFDVHDYLNEDRVDISKPIEFGENKISTQTETKIELNDGESLEDGFLRKIQLFFDGWKNFMSNAGNYDVEKLIDEIFVPNFKKSMEINNIVAFVTPDLLCYSEKNLISEYPVVELYGGVNKYFREYGAFRIADESWEEIINGQTHLSVLDKLIPAITGDSSLITFLQNIKKTEQKLIGDSK